MTNADKENEVQQNVVSSLIGVQNSDLCCFTETTVKHVEGNISWEYDEGNMSRGNIYGIVLLLLSAIVLATHSPVKIKRRHHLFRQWIIMRGYAIYSPKKNKGNQDKWKISVIFRLIGLKNLLLYVGPFRLKWLPISVAFVSEIRLDIQMNNDYYPLIFFFLLDILRRHLKTPS